MSNFQRRKGRRGELDVLARLTDAGFDGEFLYGQPALGGKQGDVTTNVGNFEVKVRARFPAYLFPAADVRAVYWRCDRKPWHVTLRAEDFEQLIRLEHALLTRGAAEMSVDVLTAKEVAATLLNMPPERRESILEALKKSLERKSA